MKKIMLTAVAGSALMLAGCGQKEEAAPADASPAAEASVDAGASSEAAGGDAATATDAAATATGSPNQGTSGGPNG